MQALIDRFGTLRRHARKLGPYLLLEILLPGGSIVALTLFLYREGGAAAIKNKLAGIARVVEFGLCRSTSV